MVMIPVGHSPTGSELRPVHDRYDPSLHRDGVKKDVASAHEAVVVPYHRLSTHEQVYALVQHVGQGDQAKEQDGGRLECREECVGELRGDRDGHEFEGLDEDAVEVRLRGRCSKPKGAVQCLYGGVADVHLHRGGPPGHV